MSVLSIDCGLKNLAYCVLDFQDSTSSSQHPAIKEWEVFDIQAHRFEDIPIALIQSLDARKEQWVNCKTILIERQPGRNRKMVIIQHLLHAYFLIRGTVDLKTVEKVQIISALHKLGANGHGIHGKKNYSQRKKTSVIMAQDWLTTSSQDLKWKEYFEESKKKDDLADCLNQALYGYKYTQVEAPKEVSVQERYANLRPRSPTTVQERRGYSASNVLYFYRLHSDDFKERVAAQPKWNRAVNKWFGSVELCMATFAQQKNNKTP